LQRTNLSTVLRGLERKGLVERRHSPEDGRGVTVHVTTRGKSNYALVRNEWAKAVSHATGKDARDLDSALALLTKVEAGLINTRPRSAGATS
jgi:DNA-binding MarR family transcriptional regulator